MNDIAVEIIEQAAAQDVGAFEQIYKAYSGFVYSVALRILRNSADAQEATQDVFLKVYRNLSGFGFRSSLKTWVYRIAVNTALNYYRRISRQERGRINDEKAIELLPAAQSAAEGAIQHDREAVLQGLLGVLNPEQKACLILREIEGLSYAEISRVLRIPLNTVRSRLKRARAALLAHGEKRGEER